MEVNEEFVTAPSTAGGGSTGPALSMNEEFMYEEYNAEEWEKLEGLLAEATAAGGGSTRPVLESRSARREGGELTQLIEDQFRFYEEESQIVNTGESRTARRATTLGAGTSGTRGDDSSATMSLKFVLRASGKVAAEFAEQVVEDAVRKIPNAAIDKTTRLWMFPVSSLQDAEKVIRESPGSNVKLETLNELPSLAIRAASASAAVDEDLKDCYELMPGSIESKLLPFQQEGVRFILQHRVRVLLADEMGLGKTVQAIAVATCLAESWPVLVLVPSSLWLQWACMIQDWVGTNPSMIHVILTNYSGSNKRGFTITNNFGVGGDFYIVPYDVVPKVNAQQFKMVIADESHYLKNAEAAETIASLRLLKGAQYAMLLSGAPAFSRPIELFKQLEALYPDVYKNVNEFADRYCKGGLFRLNQGLSNHEELRGLMKATVMIRRLKEEVCSELPEKRRQQVFLDMGNQDMSNIQELFRQWQEVNQVIEAGYNIEGYQGRMSPPDEWNFILDEMYTESATAKIPAVLDYLRTLIEAGVKFIVYAHHQLMIDSIHKFLRAEKVECIRIERGATARTIEQSTNDFQEHDYIKAAVLSLDAGLGEFKLSAASIVVFAELCHQARDLIQAENRALRAGKISAVNAYYLLASDTVDDILWEVVKPEFDSDDSAQEAARKRQKTTLLDYYR